MGYTNEQMNEYMKARYTRRRTEWIELLGGKCVVCSTDQLLEFDHIDFKDKSFDVSKALSGWSQKRLTEEMYKCQLMCKTHHKEKTRKDMALKTGQNEYWQHGTISGSDHCKCDPCRGAKNAYMREWKKRKKQKSMPS